MEMIIRELQSGEFRQVEQELWSQYHQQKADVVSDRIFGAFGDGQLVGAARVRRHADGLEVDGVFVREEERGRGIARLLMDHVIAQVGGQVLWMHSLLELVPFYSTYGFRPVPEKDLPPTIKERLVFCMGEMEGCGVQPMVRIPSR